ncbi:NAD(P)-dependent oxidoreductase [Paracoccus nototheniae]|uniref:NAD-dependent epimerase/dehydratase family protein n=1 Tax=Paracoccus nototheniae TaxID=2489002 RepID=A0ABW4DZ80_9RHOB|nr:NAD(P)-dependent oxidoreductase [Paracoccus nototheniae]
MQIALTGASGIIGHFAARALTAAGHRVTPLDRAHDWHLGQPARLEGHDALIHCAFAHAPGRYRGGEGCDAPAFIAANLDGTRRLFDQAADQSVGRILFFSSRAVHDGHPPGMRLSDDLPPKPTTLYGEVKAEAEAYLARLPLITCAIRATGVYGPGPAHKWRRLFDDYRAGHPIAPRVATEVHADDLAQALILLLNHPAPPPTLNCSDLILDHHDLLGMVRTLTACPHPPPPRADASHLRLPDCTTLESIGWQPGGLPLLAKTLADLLKA